MNKLVKFNCLGCDIRFLDSFPDILLIHPWPVGLDMQILNHAIDQKPQFAYSSKSGRWEQDLKARLPLILFPILTFCLTNFLCQGYKVMKCDRSSRFNIAT